MFIDLRLTICCSYAKQMEEKIKKNKNKNKNKKIQGCLLYFSWK